jgi:hypothetical protein
VKPEKNVQLITKFIRASKVLVVPELFFAYPNLKQIPEAAFLQLTSFKKIPEDAFLQLISHHPDDEAASTSETW